MGIPPGHHCGRCPGTGQPFIPPALRKQPLVPTAVHKFAPYCVEIMTDRCFGQHHHVTVDIFAMGNGQSLRLNIFFAVDITMPSQHRHTRKYLL